MCNSIQIKEKRLQKIFSKLEKVRGKWSHAHFWFEDGDLYGITAFTAIRIKSFIHETISSENSFIYGKGILKQEEESNPAVRLHPSTKELFSSDKKSLLFESQGIRNSFYSWIVASDLISSAVAKKSGYIYPSGLIFVEKEEPFVCHLIGSEHPILHIAFRCSGFEIEQICASNDYDPS